MHSSRMRTVRCSGRPLRGVRPGGCLPGGCLPGGVAARQGVCQGGCQGCVCGRHPPMDRMADTCKNITLPQLRCCGKNLLFLLFH